MVREREGERESMREMERESEREREGERGREREREIGERERERESEREGGKGYVIIFFHMTEFVVNIGEKVKVGKRLVDDDIFNYS